MSRRPRIKRRAIVDLEVVAAEREKDLIPMEKRRLEAEDRAESANFGHNAYSSGPRQEVSEDDILKELSYIEEEQKDFREGLTELRSLKQRSKESPIIITKPQFVLATNQFWDEQDYTRFILFHHLLYGIAGPYSDEEFKLLCLQEFDKERKYFENLKRKYAELGDAEESEAGVKPRRSIPEKVRIFVWRRDGGKCAKCGLRERLEYDHIIPVSKGGGNTARNIELLCEECNRSKGNSIC